ncbi:MAG: hypothetical protein JJE44_10820 [Flavobacteriaceae bacterium]|nr:hypothetical protein [Flavobacteriaceae bacterium]
MDSYKSSSFFKLTIRFALVFFVVITIIKIIISMFKNGGISGMVSEYFSAEIWLQFLTIQLVMSLVYGLLMAGYYKFIKK